MIAWRWVLPRFADIFFLVFLIILAFTPLSAGLLGDADTGWHIRTGEQIMATHAVPRADPFSYTMQGKPWYAWEWLYDLAMAAVHHVAGLNGVVLLTAAVISLTFALLFHFLLRRSRNLVVAAMLTLLAAAAAQVHMLARPHIVSWLLALLWVECLYRFAEGNHAALLWLPWLMLLWVNLKRYLTKVDVELPQLQLLLVVGAACPSGATNGAACVQPPAGNPTQAVAYAAPAGGDPYAQPAHDLIFSGLTFSHTSWLEPNTDGLANQQTGGFLVGPRSNYPGGGQTPMFEAARPHWLQMPAAVQVSAAKNISFVRDRFVDLGEVSNMTCPALRASFSWCFARAISGEKFAKVGAATAMRRQPAASTMRARAKGMGRR